MKHSINRAKSLIQETLWNSLGQAIRGLDNASFFSLLEGPPNLKKLLYLLRERLRSPHYQQMKREANDTEVRLLHTLCVELHTGVSVLEVYRALHTEFLQKKESLRPPINDRTLRYFFQYPYISWQALSSTSLGRVFFGERYDPKGKLENYPCGLMDISQGVRLIYTPSPTYGLDIAPEVLGLLQALKNGQNGYQGWLYVNLQDMTSGDEARRSKQLMQLNERYADTFFGITLSQDAGIYTTCPKKALLDPVNFTLHSPHGYYFPAKTEEAKAFWLARIEAIINEANRIANKVASLQDRQTVFRELLNLGIIHFFIGQQSKRPLLMSVACKESIDRGGKMNALLLWANQGPQAMDDVLACLNVRALVVRYRQIQQRRLDEALILLRSISHDELTSYLTKVIS